MSKKKITSSPSDSPDNERYFGALLEDLNDKFQIVVEATTNINERLDRWEPMVEQIPEIQAKMDRWEPMIEQIPGILTKMDRWEPMVEQIPGILAKMDHWEPMIEQIPEIGRVQMLIFEEVGKLREDVEVLKAALKILDLVDQRLTRLEEKVG